VLGSDLSLERFQVASGCLEVISGMGTSNLVRFSTVLQETKAGANDFISVRFVHEKSLSNVEAHGLAKSSASLEPGRHIWLLNTPDTFCIPLNFDFFFQNGGIPQPIKMMHMAFPLNLNDIE
jgi:hypothetical protein